MRMRGGSCKRRSRLTGRSSSHKVRTIRSSSGCSTGRTAACGRSRREGDTSGPSTTWHSTMTRARSFCRAVLSTTRAYSARRRSSSSTRTSISARRPSGSGTTSGARPISTCRPSSMWPLRTHGTSTGPTSPPSTRVSMKSICGADTTRLSCRGRSRFVTRNSGRPPCPRPQQWPSVAAATSLSWATRTARCIAITCSPACTVTATCGKTVTGRIGPTGLA
mmetsp:Transcript_34651/g.99742  ORF Transcript_34651/g.99742 Transcript_34651/m.99742 type:complete len:221 (-) Transcript_34651:164-826(-)